MRMRVLALAVIGNGESACVGREALLRHSVSGQQIRSADAFGAPHIVYITTRCCCLHPQELELRRTWHSIDVA